MSGIFHVTFVTPDFQAKCLVVGHTQLSEVERPRSRKGDINYMEKMEKPSSNFPFTPIYAKNFDHRITYVAAYLDTLTCLLLHNRLLKAHTKLLEAHTSLLETHTRLLEAKIRLVCNSNSTQFHSDSDTIQKSIGFPAKVSS